LTSHVSIYRQIGYRRVTDFSRYAFS